MARRKKSHVEGDLGRNLGGDAYEDIGNPKNWYTKSGKPRKAKREFGDGVPNPPGNYSTASTMSSFEAERENRISDFFHTCLFVWIPTIMVVVMVACLIFIVLGDKIIALLG